MLCWGRWLRMLCWGHQPISQKWLNFIVFHSERTLRLSALCLEKNSANYTVWHYRRQCIEALGKDQDEAFIRGDLQFAARMGGANPKSYQLWYHRQALLEKISIEHFGTSELEYIAEVLEADSKNYHAWSLRQWVVLQLSKNSEDAWQKELDFGELWFRSELQQCT